MDMTYIKGRAADAGAYQYFPGFYTFTEAQMKEFARFLISDVVDSIANAQEDVYRPWQLNDGTHITDLITEEYDLEDEYDYV